MSTPIIALIAFAVAVISGVLCARIAGMKGRHPTFYGVLGFFLPLITLLALVILPSKRRVVPA